MWLLVYIINRDVAVLNITLWTLLIIHIHKPIPSSEGLSTGDAPTI